MWRFVSQVVRNGLRCGGEARCGTATEPPRPAPLPPPPRQRREHWCEKEVRDSWFNTFTWSSALILGWYTSQFACLRSRQCGWNKNVDKRNNYQKVFYDNTKRIHSVVLSHVAFAQPPSEDMINNLVKVKNVNGDGTNLNNVFPNKKSEVIPEFEFKEVLQSIENKLGLVAIEEGNIKEGLAMLRSSAEKKYAPALYNLGVCFEKGVGVKRDEIMALELYKAAASKCHPGALYNLAVYYGQGRGGLTRDPTIAEDLLRVAAAKGQEEAASALKHLNCKKNENIDCVQDKTENKSSSTATFLEMIGCDVNISNYESKKVLLF